MKQILFLLLIFSSLSIQAQSISKQIVGSSGQSITNGTYILNFTISEPIVGIVENGITINQGFWAVLIEDETLSIEALDSQTETISVFPNPAVNFLQIKFKNRDANNYTTQLYGVNGKQIFKLNPKLFGKTIQYNVSQLATGMYVLAISDKKSNYKKSFKFLKQ